MAIYFEFRLNFIPGVLFDESDQTVSVHYMHYSDVTVEKVFSVH